MPSDCRTGDYGECPDGPQSPNSTCFNRMSGVGTFSPCRCAHGNISVWMQTGHPQGRANGVARESSSRSQNATRPHLLTERQRSRTVPADRPKRLIRTTRAGHLTGLANAIDQTADLLASIAVDREAANESKVLELFLFRRNRLDR